MLLAGLFQQEAWQQLNQVAGRKLKTPEIIASWMLFSN
jgi:hypothetical protein